MFEVITTVTPKTNKDKLLSFAENGATIFRINGSFSFGKELIAEVNRIRSSVEGQVRLLLDLPGYKIRFSNLNKSVQFEKGRPFSISRETFNYPEFFQKISAGDVIRINDGMDILVIDELLSDSVVFTANRSGTVEVGKGLHLDGNSYRPDTESLSQRDYDLIELATKHNVDYVGLSFVYSLEDIQHVNECLGDANTVCIPKIEAKESIRNLYEIVQRCEIVIIDRGDLAGEIGLSNIWKAQRDIISLAKMCSTKVVVATQILSSMTTRPLPSIAEVDSLYSLLDLGIDGIQLSDETASGKYAKRAVSFLSETVNDYQLYKRSSSQEKGAVIWLMGPTASGKTTIGKEIVKKLERASRAAVQYDGDEFRDQFGKNFGFSDTDRLAVVSSLTHFANKWASKGNNVVISALTANEDTRTHIEKNIQGLVKVYVECSIDECIRRDPKGLYKRAIEGEIKSLIGFNSEYIAPQDVALTVNTEKKTATECADEIVRYLLSGKYLNLW